MQVSQAKASHKLPPSWTPAAEGGLSATHGWERMVGEGRETRSENTGGWEENPWLGEEGVAGEKCVGNNFLHFLFCFPLAASAAGGEEPAQCFDFRGFCPSWDHGAQGSLPLGSLLSVSWGSHSSTLCTCSFPRSWPTLAEGWRPVTLVWLLGGVRPRRFLSLPPSRLVCNLSNQRISGAPGRWCCPPALQSQPLEGHFCMSGKGKVSEGKGLLQSFTVGLPPAGATLTFSFNPQMPLKACPVTKPGCGRAGFESRLGCSSLLSGCS